MNKIKIAVFTLFAVSMALMPHVRAMGNTDQIYLQKFLAINNAKTFALALDLIPNNMINTSMVPLGYTSKTVLSHAIWLWDIDLIKKVIAKGAKVKPTHVAEAKFFGITCQNPENKAKEICDVLSSNIHGFNKEHEEKIKRLVVLYKNLTSSSPAITPFLEKNNLSLNVYVPRALVPGSSVFVHEPLVVYAACYKPPRVLLQLLGHGINYDRRLHEHKNSYSPDTKKIIELWETILKISNRETTSLDSLDTLTSQMKELSEKYPEELHCLKSLCLRHPKTIEKRFLLCASAEDFEQLLLLQKQKRDTSKTYPKWKLGNSILYTTTLHDVSFKYADSDTLV